LGSRRAVIITTSVLVVVIGAMVAYGAWRVLNAAPNEVSLDAAVASEQFRVDGAGVTTVNSSNDGYWYVDSNSGSFTFDESSGSFVGFRVEEELAQIGSMTAVGRTGEIQGELLIEDGQLVGVVVSADLSAIVTNDSRRDRAARHALNVSENPMATFVLAGPVALPETDNSPVSIEVVGRLTINGIARDVPLVLDAQIVGNTIVVVGSMEVTFGDYDVTVPSAIIVVSAQDHGIIEFQLLFTRG
jgi:polyisoprenoid-binding protein YceI